ncbi:glycosyltransferase [Edwardsiella tarda]|uniref:glycosyltransferase n=1 Tax=Edwardsiella tarda TaxID=636 RepID=UPI00351C1EB0
MSLFSIITVCYNPPMDSLINTVSSVMNNIASANTIDIEYIIVDGGSRYEVVDFLNKLKCNCRSNIRIKIISEPDDGIYDAMNKGIDYSSGNWLIFMNAGDRFFSNTILKDLIYNLDNKNTVIYGDMINNDLLIKALPENYIKKGIIMACHQSMIFNKTLLGKVLKYDKSYPIYADYELIVRILSMFGDSMLYINKPISIYEGGFLKRSLLEKEKINIKYCIDTMVL